MSSKVVTFNEALRDATAIYMEKDPNVFVIGLGVNYKNAGSTAGLVERFPDRILDSPNAEASTTGACVGAAINGLRPIIVHGRVEFALFGADAIFTQGAKWNYSFGGDNPVPIVFRITVGRQWGNCPQHSQALYSLFGNTTGLKTVIPSTPYMAKGLLASAIRDNNPVVLLESLFLGGLKQEVPDELYFVELDKAKTYCEGSDITVVAYGDGLIETIQSLELLKDKNVSVELIDLVSLNPIDYDAISRSVEKTGRLLTIDTTNNAFCVGSEIISKVCERNFASLKMPPHSIAAPNVPVPTTHALSKFYYPNKGTIANKILSMLDKQTIDIELSFEELNFGPKILVK